MDALAQALKDEGFAVCEALLDSAECERLDQLLGTMSIGRAGSRTLLQLPWCAQLAQRLKKDSPLSPLLDDLVAVQCTLFEKAADRNWLVSPHQDLSIPVAARLDTEGLTGWSLKEGVHYVQAPEEVLSRLLAVRIHVDECGEADGPLRVVPRSHHRGRLDADAISAQTRNGDEVVCPVARGGAMLMRPLLLHASSKASGTSRRRVLHFLFGPHDLPAGLRWHATA